MKQLLKLPCPFTSLRIVLTPRGLIFLGCAIYLAFAPGLQHADIIASVLGGFLFLVISGVTLAAVLQSLKLSSALSVEFPVSDDTRTHGICTANFEQSCVIKLSGRRLFPFFEIRILPEFEHQGAVFPSLIIRDSDAHPALLPLPLIFPHRGIWRIEGFLCSLQDQFGFTCFRWRLPSSHAIRVEPNQRADSAIPPMSSSHRSGDMAIDVLHRQGEPFDLKRYHPSDGIKKILWKVYAKSRVLISRHPEASFSPEGQVAIFVVARDTDDSPCSEAVAYMKLLEEENLEIFLGSASFSDKQIAQAPDAALDLLIETAWGYRPGLSGLEAYVADLKLRLGDSQLDRILIFFSESMLEKDQGYNELVAMSGRLSRDKISPVFILCEDKLRPAASPRQRSEGVYINAVKGLLVDIPQFVRPPLPALRSAFLSACDENNWEIIAV